ncbi:MAG: VTT domain-containing protein [Nocardioides sp.]
MEPTGTRGRAWAWARVGALAALLLAVFVVEQVRGWDDVRLLREQVAAAGALGAAVFVAGYAVLVLLPAPKALLTALGGALYGLWLGAFLSWVAALVGAAAAFGLGRAIGRNAVDRLTRGRVARADRLLSEHGLGAVVAVRLVPVLPFTAINYTAGLTGVRWRHYAAGSAVGIVPGSLAYAALGAWGTDPWGIFAGVAVLVALVVVGGLVGRALLGHDDRAAIPADEEGS